MADEVPALEIVNLSKTFELPNGKKVRALDRINLVVQKGNFFGLVGESGSGKTTLANCILRLIEPDRGSIRINGKDWLNLRGRLLKQWRKQVQIVFQDPYTSINPLFKIREVVREPLQVQKIGTAPEQEERVLEVLELVEFPSGLADRHPHELSGGQRQRVAIARALASRPSLLVADEPVSSLDKELQDQITQLFSKLCRQSGVTLIYITHDLNVVGKWCSDIGVMYRGRLLESGSTAKILRQPAEEYTRQLLREAFHES